jgi:outer membrane protein assembly factor BamB
MPVTNLGVLRCLSLLVIAAFSVGAGAARAADWPQWLGPQRDGVWRETGLVEKFPPGGPRVRWRVPIGEGYSGPAEAGGRIYVMDRRRTTGPDGKPLRPTRKGILGTERVLCLDAATGKLLWKHEYDCPYKIDYALGPRTTPLVAGGRVYTLGAMGDLLCLDVGSGKVLWSRRLMKDYRLDDPPVWGWAAHPLLDGDLLYCLVGGQGSAVVAFHKDTGREAWRALTSDEIGYSPPVICEAGGKRQLIVWLSDSVNSLDPATGQAYWTQQWPTAVPVQRPAVNIVMPRCAGDRVFVTNFYHGSLMLKLDSRKPAATVLWQGKSNNPGRPDGLHGVMATPVFKGGCVYGVGGYGELCCVDADTGKLLWKTYQATARGECANAFLVPQGDRFVLYNDQGDLILARMSRAGYKEIDRAHLLEPDREARGRKAAWSHPAFAHRCVFARNSQQIVCVSLAESGQEDKP